MSSELRILYIKGTFRHENLTYPSKQTFTQIIEESEYYLLI